MLISYRDLKISRKKYNLELKEFIIEENKHTLISGKNGSGKTTLLNLIVGLNKKFKISFSDKKEKLNKRIFFVPDSTITLFENLTMKEILIFLDLSREMYEKECRNLKIDEPSQEVELKKLSLGQRKKAIILFSFISNADIYIYDEPFAGIDKDSLEYIVEKINSFKTIVLVSHDEISNSKLKIDKEYKI